MSRLFLLLVLLCAPLRAEEPFFKKGDVIAIVGGEDMVALSEYGYLELLLTRALPDFHLRFRNLAWEGDTVFEQRRDLGFPAWEEQLAKIDATVVLCQFGQMESLAGKEKLPEFSAAYEKLLARFSGGGKRRVCIAEPLGFNPAWLPKPALAFSDYQSAIHGLALRVNAKNPASISLLKTWSVFFSDTLTDHLWAKDCVHLSASGHDHFAQLLAFSFAVQVKYPSAPYGEAGDLTRQQHKRLADLIIAKNRLWFDYWRVQNWAFLAGDRTNQPSSREHLDPAKRWFPEERERFLPLIEAREKEIDALAAQLAQP